MGASFCVMRRMCIAWPGRPVDLGKHLADASCRDSNAWVQALKQSRRRGLASLRQTRRRDLACPATQRISSTWSENVPKVQARPGRGAQSASRRGKTGWSLDLIIIMLVKINII